MPERRSYAPDPEYRHPLQRFRKLMPHRVRRVLLVSSRYDSFLLGEDGRLGELILNEFLDLSLGADPWLTRVSTGSRALAAARHREFDLVLMTLHIRDMDVHELVRKLKGGRPSLPVVPLAFDDRELRELLAVGVPLAPVLEVRLGAHLPQELDRVRLGRVVRGFQGSLQSTEGGPHRARCVVNSLVWLVL